MDAYIAQHRVNAPPVSDDNSDLGYTGPRFIPVAPDHLSLREENITGVVWATGFEHDFSWLKAPFFDAFGYPIQKAGRTSVHGPHFLGLNYVDRRGSGILDGVGEDARQLADIAVEELEKAH